MSDLLREMDHGPAALPPGSQLTLLNNTMTPETLPRLTRRNRLRSLRVRHVTANPMDYDEVSSCIDVRRQGLWTSKLT